MRGSAKLRATKAPSNPNVRFLPIPVMVHPLLTPASRRDRFTTMKKTLLNAAAAVLTIALLAAWAFTFIYEPLVAGKWLAVITVIALVAFWAALKAAARRKAESIDYRRR